MNIILCNAHITCKLSILIALRTELEVEKFHVISIETLEVSSPCLIVYPLADLTWQQLTCHRALSVQVESVHV